MIQRAAAHFWRHEARRSKRHKQTHSMRVQRVANAIHALPVHHAAVLEIRVVKRLESCLAAHEELSDGAGPGDEDRGEHVVHEGVAGGFEVRDLSVRFQARARACVWRSWVTLLASKSSMTPLTCWKVAIASFLP